MPRATIVRPITFSETPHSRAIVCAFSLRRLAPIAIIIAPTTNKTMSFNFIFYI